MCNLCNDPTKDHGVAMPDRRSFITAGLGLAAASVLWRIPGLAEDFSPQEQEPLWAWSRGLQDQLLDALAHATGTSLA